MWTSLIVSICVSSLLGKLRLTRHTRYRHCVNYTTRDLVDNYPKGQWRDICVLSDTRYIKILTLHLV